MNLSFVAAFAALKVSFPGACPGKDDISYFYEETTSSLRAACETCMEGIHVRRHGSLPCMPPFFSPCSSFVILLFFALLLDDDTYRRTLKAVGVSEAVFDISLIREVEQLGAVAENYKRRRLYSRLGHIVEL